MALSQERNAGHTLCKGVSRREFVRLCGVIGTGLAASPFLAACGRSARAEPGGGKPLSGGPEAGDGETIVEASGVEPGSAVPFIDAASGEQGVLLRLQSGRLAAYSAICTHQGCVVAHDAEEGTLECPCHNSIFDPENGAEVLSGPAPSPLPEIPVKVEDGRVVRAG